MDEAFNASIRPVLLGGSHKETAVKKERGFYLEHRLSTMETQQVKQCMHTIEFCEKFCLTMIDAANKYL